MSFEKNSSGIPASTLEQEAIQQRRLVHNSVSELRSQVEATVREKLDVERYAREYLKPASGTAFLLSFFIGFGVAGTLKQIFR